MKSATLRGEVFSFGYHIEPYLLLKKKIILVIYTKIVVQEAVPKCIK